MEERWITGGKAFLISLSTTYSAMALYYTTRQLIREQVERVCRCHVHSAKSKTEKCGVVIGVTEKSQHTNISH
jgi:hypothetical protein